LACNVVYKRSVGRDLKKTAKPAAARILARIEEELSKNAEACPPLKGPFAGLRKCRIGDYRVIFSVVGEEILILRIGHRHDVYQKPIPQAPRKSQRQG